MRKQFFNLLKDAGLLPQFDSRTGTSLPLSILPSLPPSFHPLTPPSLPPSQAPVATTTTPMPGLGPW